MKNLSLAQKIWCIVGLLSFAFVFSAVFSVMELLNARDSLNEITGKHVVRDQLTSEIRDNQRRISSNTMEGILRTDEANMKRVNRTLTETIEKMDNDIKAYMHIASDQGKEIMNKYIVEYKNYLEAVNNVRELSQQNKNEEAVTILFAQDASISKMREYMNEINKITAARLAEISAESNERASRSITISALASTVSILLSLIIAFATLRAITRAIAEVVRNLSDSSIQVSGAATQIASSAEELSQAATEQAASLEETAASVEEMNSMIAKNSENAKSAEDTSGRSQEAVGHGKDVIQKMAESMEAINRSSEGMAETVKVIEQIDKKTKVINEIVNKTELLSFNASVEAARAGEHGKGFAVVAEEVGNLARMSGAAAEEIATLLEESIRKVNQMVLETKKNVENGSNITTQCGEVFEQIVTNVSSVSGMATEISSASQEQARGCSEITKAMTQLDQMTQQNAATSEECASAAEELSAQAEALKNAVSHLVFTVNGASGSSQQFAPVATAAPQAARPVVHAGKKDAKVLSLKTAKSSTHGGEEMKLRKASGAPGYDSDGFKEI